MFSQITLHSVECTIILLLFFRFWKFNLQTLARYRVWMETMTEAVRYDPSLNDQQSHRNVKEFFFFLQAAINQLSGSKIDFLIQLYSDGSTLSDKFPMILDVVKHRLGDGVSLQVLQSMESKMVFKFFENFKISL